MARDIELERRLLLAHSNPLRSTGNENTRQALQDLFSFGLVPEVTDIEKISESSIPTAQFIAKKLLNQSSEKKYSPFQLALHMEANVDPPYISIPPRSKLALYQLSKVLRVKIYLFSSRKKSILFEHAGATSSIGLFHRIDSFLNVSEFLALVPIAQTPKVQVSPVAIEPLPYSNEIPVAAFREQNRGNNKRNILDFPTKEVCVSALRIAWYEISLFL